MLEVNQAGHSDQPQPLNKWTRTVPLMRFLSRLIKRESTVNATAVSVPNSLRNPGWLEYKRLLIPDCHACVVQWSSKALIKQR